MKEESQLIIFEGNIKDITRQKMWGFGMLVFFIVLFSTGFLLFHIADLFINIVLIMIALLCISLPIIVAIPMHYFRIATNGISLARRPWWMIFAKKEFIYYNEIKSIRKENIRYSEMQPKEGLWVFYLTLKNDKEVYISIRDVGQQLDSEKQLNKAYGMLNVIMDELQKPENIEKYRKGEEIILPREIFNHHPHHS